MCITFVAAEPPPDSLANDLGKLVNSDNFSDVVFLVEGRKVYAHKAILVVRSEYFNAMFSNSMQESFKASECCLGTADLTYNVE